MPLSELDLQSRLVDAVKEVGGYGYKQSNKFLAGPPDLYLSIDSTGPVFVEVKLNDLTQSTVLITPLQEICIQRMQKAGSRCGVLVIKDEGLGNYHMFFTTDPTKKKIDGTFKEFYKKRGEPWPITDIMAACDTLPHRL